MTAPPPRPRSPRTLARTGGRRAAGTRSRSLRRTAEPARLRAGLGRTPVPEKKKKKTNKKTSSWDLGPRTSDARTLGPQTLGRSDLGPGDLGTADLGEGHVPLPRGGPPAWCQGPRRGVHSHARTFPPTSGPLARGAAEGGKEEEAPAGGAPGGPPRAKARGGRRAARSARPAGAPRASGCPGPAGGAWGLKVPIVMGRVRIRQARGGIRGENSSGVGRPGEAGGAPKRRGA